MPTEDSDASALQQFRHAYRDHFGEHRRERQFISTGGFFLIVGYLWILQIGTAERPSPRLSRVTSFLFGAGAALTLDEFALWLNLEDDYWTAKGRESIDAVVLFGTMLSLGALGGGVLPKFGKRLRGG
jgi:hypothetical protein